MKPKVRLNLLMIVVSFAALFVHQSVFSAENKKPVDYVNPYMGNISHLLVPTFPTIHLPNSLLRVYPERGDYTNIEIHALPLVV